MTKLKVRFEDLNSVAGQFGLSILAATDVSPLTDAGARLDAWQKSGYGASMQFMLRDSRDLSDPGRLLSGAESLVVFAVRYDCTPTPVLPEGYGRVARYARGRDYHDVFGEILPKFVQEVSRKFGVRPECRCFSDAVPLLERAVAHRAGIGFFGRNTMLIRKGFGSFFFLAEVIWNVEITDLPDGAASSEGCGSCCSCMHKCPAEALVDDCVLDASKCISFLTIEKRGAFSAQEREVIGEWIFGCDSCQECCPFNLAVLKRESSPAIEAFLPDGGVGPSLKLEDVLAIRSNGVFRRRFEGTPLLRAKREGLLRNAAAVAANTQSAFLWQPLVDACAEDPSPVVRTEALASLGRLFDRCAPVSAENFRGIVERMLQDSDPLVRSEARLRTSCF